MRILELSFKNLNSLYGEWKIDFTDPEYVYNGVFVLTGPTGAGKSTILDAICLALYGATPRLGKITKSGNEIMSRQTGECYAEVLFESKAGRFRCRWDQRRARKKSDGRLQDYHHQISDADTGRFIQTKKSLVGGVIEEKTGMDLDRFTRSMLLAQGGFDTFLRAGVEQKSRILEQITGTGIYSEISRRVHERQRNEWETLKLLKAEISGIVVLEPVQEEKFQDDLKVKENESVELAGKITEINSSIAWLITLEDLTGEILSLTDEAARLKTEIEAFQPKRVKLRRSIKAASLDGAYAKLQILRTQQAENQAALITEVDKLPELETSAKNQAKALKTAKQITIQSKEDLNAATPLIQDRSVFLIEELQTRAIAISEFNETLFKEAREIETNKQALEEGTRKTE